MLIDNTEENLAVANVAASMAMEGIPLSKDFAITLLKVSNGEMTFEQLFKELHAEYAR